MACLAIIAMLYANRMVCAGLEDLWQNLHFCAAAFLYFDNSNHKIIICKKKECYIPI
jgi:hypothetical protein